MGKDKESRVQKLFQQVTELREKDAVTAGQLTFLARLLIQVTLPHREPKGAVTWSRHNGDITFTIQPQITLEKGVEKNHGVPFGTIPRLLLCFITREAVVTKNPKIVLGSSLSQFMAELGMAPTGGRWGSITRLKEQVKRLFSCRITFSCIIPGKVFALQDHRIVKETLLWWDTKHPDQMTLEDSYILLDQDFFEELINNPVPLDMRALRALKQSPLALDLYAWLTYRVSYLREPAVIGWETLAEQFGAEYRDIKHFRAEARKHLQKIMALWPGLKIDPAGKDHVTLYPCAPQVKRQTKTVDNPVS